MGLYHKQPVPLPLYRCHERSPRTRLGAQERRPRGLQQEVQNAPPRLSGVLRRYRIHHPREKQLKGWSRAKKIALIEKINPGWEDLTPSFGNLGPSTAAPA